MRVLKKYLHVYQAYFAMNLAQASSFRMHFVLVILVDIFFYASSLLSVSFIYDHVDTIGPWTREEFLFFVSFMLAIDHLHMMLVAHGYWEFSRELRTGDLDFKLLKPIGTLFPIFFDRVRPGSALLIFVPWGCLIYFGVQAGLSPLSWVLLPFLVVVAFTLAVSIQILIAMVMFWTIESIGINFLRMQLQSLSRWPDFVYLYFFRKFFTFFIPVLIVGSAPVKFLFDYSVWQPLALVCAMILLFFWLIRVFWRIGLRRYESASS